MFNFIHKLKLQPKTLMWLHLVSALIWIVLMIPTVIWWKDSVLFVSICSLYANAFIHIGGYGAARAERKQEVDSNSVAK